MMNTLRRRSFLQRFGIAVPAILTLPGASLRAAILNDSSPGAPSAEAPHELKADLVIIGGGLGGCAAALAAGRNGLSVLLTEETDWIGGQLTAQAVPPDENPWIETFGGTRSYLDLRRRIREYYSRNYPLTAQARAQAFLNPGNGAVSRLCHEPRVALAAIQEMLAPLVSSQRVRILPRCKAVSAEAANDHVQAVVIRNLETGHHMVLRGRFFADATELGDLLPLTGTEYVVGAESQKTTNEPHAPANAAPGNQQSFTCCFAMDYLAGEDHRISRPEEYNVWRDFAPVMHPA